MSWNKMGVFATLSLAFIFTACGGDSGSNVASENVNSGNYSSQEKNTRLEYKTYEGLIAEEPCNAALSGVAAYVRENNTEYVCSYDIALKIWKWNITVIHQSSSSAFDGWSSSNLSSQETLDIINYTDTSETVEELLYGTKTVPGVGWVIPRHSCSISSKSAYIQSTNEVYVCIPNQSNSTNWSWQPYQEGGNLAIRNDGVVYKTFIDSRDGNIYSMAYVGGILWMLENLRLDTNKGDSCFFGKKLFNTDIQNSNIEFCNLGRIYSQYVALDGAGVYSSNAKGCSEEEINHQYTRVLGKDCNPLYPMRGICPQGWHIPDTTELKLGDHIPNDVFALQSVNQYNTQNSQYNIYEPDYVVLNSYTRYWTSTYATTHNQHSYLGVYDEVSMFYVYNNSYTNADRFESPKGKYYAVRCIKDDNIW